ncbi:ANTAR domain-containing protein [Rhodovarius crocodyli]|uniref:ANTAR domain-containing protein n=1 Tax=Rhodovarius crocodyli TaxID=1979269 RepID=A0A437MPW0_9PROT|nr:ANTAR domain-containing protein [Rhodovarius crocodyli]
MRVLLVDTEPERAARLRLGLEESGFSVVAVSSDAARLTELVRASQADIIVCDMDDPSRDSLESMRALHRDEPRPVVLFAGRAAPELMADALQAGVAAYVTEGLDPARVRPVLEMANMQFKAFHALREQLAQARATLAERETVDQAKRRMMREMRLTEPEAHKRLQRMAMERGAKMVDVARSVLAKI